MTTTIDNVVYVTRAEAAKMLGMTPGTIRTYCGNGTLKTTPIMPGRSMLSLAEVKRFKRDRDERLKKDRRGSYRRRDR